jgi:hypothetical protein
MKKLLTFNLLLVLILLLSSCGAGGNAVKSGQNVDYVGAVEQRVNGAYFVFGMYDSSNAFCTLSADVALRATKLLRSHELAIITYSGINSGDTDGETLFGTSGCENTEKVQVLRLNDIQPINVGKE